jgi:hypothetical protein
LGILPKFNDNFITGTTGNLYQIGSDFLEVKGERPFSISEILSGFITAVESRFTGGRGYFYIEQKVSLIDQRKNIISSLQIRNGRDFTFKRIKDSLYQYTHLINFDVTLEENPNNFIAEQNLPFYGYFTYDGWKMEQLSSNRRFAFTKFVEIDSSFLVGDFDVWDFKTGQSSKSDFVSMATLELMRNEILAEYGFIFKNQEQIDRYKYEQWYEPKTESYDEVYSKASEIDKYNLDFLNKLIGSTPGGKSI